MLERDNANTLMCIGCGKCSEVCRHTDPKLALLYLRAEYSNAQVPGCFEDTGLSMPPSEIPCPEYEKGDDAYLLPGCVVKSRLPYLEYAAAKALKALGIGISELPDSTCCMYPVPFRVMDEAERNQYKYRMRARAGGKDIVTLCAGCTNELGTSGIYAPHVSVFLSKYLNRIRALPGVKLKVAVEPGCSAERFMKEILEIVKATGAEYVGNTYGCCGKNVEGINAKLMAEREAESADADVIVVGCPNCQWFYDNYEGGKPVIHLVELVAMAAGETDTLELHRIGLGN